MGIKLIFHAIIQERVVNGVKVRQPVIQNNSYYQQHLNQFFLGDKVVITIEKKRAIRSLQQNAFYWGAVLPTILESGQGYSNKVDAEELHYILKKHLLPPRQVKIFGLDTEVPGSTKKLNKVEFYEYLEKIEKLTGIPLPNPADAGYAPFPY